MHWPWPSAGVRELDPLGGLPLAEGFNSISRPWVDRADALEGDPHGCALRRVHESMVLIGSKG